MWSHAGKGDRDMLPTTYRGDATVAGEDLDAELFLDNAHLRLLSGPGGRSEIVKWPLLSVRIEPVDRGRYRFEAGPESFEFSPLVDDGLSDEIALRSRFATTTGPVEVSPPPPPAEEPTSGGKTIADRVRSVGSRGKPSHRRRGVMSGGDLAVRTALVILSVLAIAVVTVAVVSGRFDGQPSTVVIADGEAPASTLPFTDGPAGDATPGTAAPATTVAPEPPPTTAPATTPATAPPSTSPPTTAAPATTTTQAPTTTAPTVTGTLADPGLELEPGRFVDRWDEVSRSIEADLGSAGVTIGDDRLSFLAGPRTRIEGLVGGDGTVEQFRLLGDPFGTVEEDRLVITAMGMAIAVAAPDLEAGGRRALMETLGFDFDNPSVADLDGALTYRDYEYRLYWDEDIDRVVFEIGPVGFTPFAEAASP